MTDKLADAVDAQVAALLPRYLANRAADVARIRAALDAADFETARQIAHAMKGSGGSYGLPEVSRFGTSMEESASQRDAEATANLAARLEGYLAQVEAAFPGAPCAEAARKADAPSP